MSSSKTAASKPVWGTAAVPAAFFGARSPILGVMVILPLWAMILACVIQFHPVSAWASYLMIPYLLWVTFATALNISIWRLN